MNRIIKPVISIAMLLFSLACTQERGSSVIHWSVAGELPPSPGSDTALGFAGPVVGINNNVLIVAGGANFPDGMPWEGGKKAYYADAFIYRKAAGKLSPGAQLYALPASIAYAACCSTNKGIIYAGGENGHGITNEVNMLQWDESGKKIMVTAMPGLPEPLTNAAAIVHNNIVFAAGGETADAASDRLYCIDLDDTAAGWKSLPSIPHQVSHAVLAVQSNNGHSFLYLIGGRKKNADGVSDLYAGVYAYDIDSKIWKEKESLPYPLMGGTGIASDSASILVFGGDRGETFHQSELLAAAIKKENDPEKKEALVQQKNQLLASHPGFSKEVLQYNSISDHWKILDAVPFDTPVTTTAIRWDDEVIIPGGEIRAGVRTPEILCGKQENK